jgi:hypothetical protein
MDMNWIKKCVKDSDYYFTRHGDRERMNDDLTISDIEESLICGRILEDYPDDLRGNSCLVVGFSYTGIPIHIICGERNDKLVIITVYIPKPPKFKTPYERG